MLQESLYDPSGHRFARVLAEDGGQGRISLRDGSGQVVADYLETHADSGLQLEREYVRAGGGLVATNEVCGPRPALRADDPIQTTTAYRFVKTTYTPPSPGTDTYTIALESETGDIRLLQRSESLSDHFEISAEEFFPGEVNFVRIEHRAECGSTGYSNAVSVFVPYSSDCLDTAVGYRSGFQADATSHLTLRASTSGCAPGTGFVVYYERAGTVEPMRVSPEVGIPTASWIIPNVPAGAGHGRYWFRALDGPGGTEGTVGASIVDDERTTGASVGGVPGEPSTVARYIHRDHLGSTRAVTDEAGGVRGTWKYYPFGAEANATGEPGPRMKFTGHERDGVAGLDYMMARYYGTSLSRFLSADPITIKAQRLRIPQRLNLYTYAANNPIKYFDPTGEDVSVFVVGRGTGPKEQYGHAAIFVSTENYSGGISYGGNHGFAKGKDSFISSYNADGRTVTEYKLNVTPEQEAKLAEFVKANPDGAVDQDALGASSMITENCTTAVGNALEAAGVVPEGEDPPGSGVLLDTPSNLEDDLEKGGDNEDLVKEKQVHEPKKEDQK